MAFFSVGPLAIAVLAVIALLVLGPQKLPEAARSVGKGMREMRAAMSGVRFDDEDEADDGDESDDKDDGDGGPEGENGAGPGGEDETEVLEEEPARSSSEPATRS